MSAAQESCLHLEIAHVLFLDVVGYSRLLVNEQREIVQKLNDIVRATPQFRQSSASGKLICIATGDGMALLFFQSHPNFARAHAGIADCCSFLYMYWDGSKANLEAADASSQRALELDPASAEAHTSRGVALTLRRDYAGARREFDHALRLNRVLYEAHYFYGRACFTEGKFEEALLHYRNA
jgi:tetratricopeptide (TPR) repeat protein